LRLRNPPDQPPLRFPVMIRAQTAAFGVARPHSRGLFHSCADFFALPPAARSTVFGHQTPHVGGHSSVAFDGAEQMDRQWPARLAQRGAPAGAAPARYLLVDLDGEGPERQVCIAAKSVKMAQKELFASSGISC
jgi:hypothetical protein